MTNHLIVTRHAALVMYLGEIGLAQNDTGVLQHATADDVRGKHVIGVLPLHLAAEAASVTEIPLALTADMRGRELSIDEVRAIAGEPVTYTVSRVERGTEVAPGVREITTKVGREDYFTK